MTDQQKGMAMTKDEMQALVKKHGSKAAAARALGMPRKTFHDRLNGIQSAHRRSDADSSVPSASKPSAPRRTISERDLLIETDSETRYRTNMAASLRGLKRGEYMRDFDLRRDVGAAGDASLWREVRKAPEFGAHVMEIGHGSDPAVYWGHAESVAGMIQRGKAHKPAWAKGA